MSKCCLFWVGVITAMVLALFAIPDRVVAGEVTIACWNVENLFNTRRDTEERGEPVPSAAQLDVKFRKIAEVIKHLNADIVGLVEVENVDLLRRLTRDYLTGDGYSYFSLIEQTDPRGIDVGVISKIPFTAYSFDIPSHTRGVFACRFSAGGEPFYVLFNHWKSRIGGGEDVRMACARRTVELVQDELPRYEGRAVPTLVMGDLNDDDGDRSVQSLEQGGLVNVLKRLKPADRWSYPWWDSAKKKVQYNEFDHILVNRAAEDGVGIELMPNSARVVRPDFMCRKRRLENVDYDWIDDSYGDHIGYSDHFPVLAQLVVPAAPTRPR